MLSRDDMHEYQLRAVDFVKEKKRCMLLLQMGLGKTVSTLTAIADLKDSFAINKVLVIAPLRVANSVWKQEAELWDHLRHLRFSICTGPARRRLASLHMDADVYVINRENVPWLQKQYEKNWPFDCVVVDESSSFKSPSSLRFKALRRTLPYTDYMILLTGTPSPNGLLDLWSQAYLVDYGEALGRTMGSYKSRFFEPDYMGYSFVPREGADSKIWDLLRNISLSMRSEDYLQLEEEIHIVERVDMPANARRDYAELEKEFLIEINNEEIEAINAAVLAGKLLQFANGAMYTDANGSWSLTHDAKIEALREIVEQNESENILVAYNFKSDLDRLRAAFPDAAVLDKNHSTQERWNNREIKMLLAHPASAGHGLNLQRGGSMIVWFGLNWSLEYYQQFNARLSRQGQMEPVRIVHIVANDTIDDKVLGALRDKDATQSDLLKALRS